LHPEPVAVAFLQGSSGNIHSYKWNTSNKNNTYVSESQNS